MPSPSKVLLLLWVGLGCGGAGVVRAQNDGPALAQVWQAHISDPARHAAVVQAAERFIAPNPESSFLSVARGLAAWHALAGGQTNTAVRLLSAMLSERPEPLWAEGNTMARRWLTRLDAERVRAALTQYYRDHVEFPATLEALQALPLKVRPPLLDRWGRAWRYQLIPLKRFATARGQRYLLQSPVLGEDTDLGPALQRPYAQNLPWTPVRFLTGNQSSVQFTRMDGARLALSEGAREGDVVLAYSRANLIILANGDYWLLFTR